MNQLNSVLLEGNVTADSEIVETKNGNHVTNFTVCSNSYFKKNGEVIHKAMYIDVENWISQIELKKGEHIRVVGHLGFDRWINKDGENRSKNVIIAEMIEIRKFEIV